MNTLEIVPVSKYLDSINHSLLQHKSKVVGEVSGLKAHQNGHYYFSLLDKADGSKMDCVIWRSNYKIFGVNLTDGLEIIVNVTPNLYKPNGRLSFIVNTVELVGEGALQIAYEELRKKLDGEGLFAESKKRALPDLPHKIGVITSRSGAVIHDFLGNLGKFGYEIIFVDSKVEGQDAVKELLAALDAIEKEKIDVLVMMRGGGSLESFLAFNNEVLVRRVASFPVPVITGIGHDKDIPLVSFASDRNVSTPTAVTALLNSTWLSALGEIKISEQKIFAVYESWLKELGVKIDRSFLRIESKFNEVLEFFKEAEGSILHFLDIIESNISRFSEKISFLEKSLKVNDPRRQLSLGYSIIKSKSSNKIVRSKKDVKKGEKVDILVSDGTIETQVI